MKALGMIETVGLIGAIEAADIATKTANVEILNKHFISAGIVTVEITGDIGAVKVAIEAAEESVKKLGLYVSSNVIARPSESIANLILDNLEKENFKTLEKVEKTETDLVVKEIKELKQEKVTKKKEIKTKN